MGIKRLLVALCLAAGSVSAVAAGSPAVAADAIVPVGKMLRPVDAGPGYRVSAEEVVGDWNFGYIVSQCEAATWSGVDAVADRGRELAVGGEPGGPADGYVIQEVRRYASAGNASSALTDVGRNARDCAEFNNYGPDGELWGVMRITVVTEGFAGDGSILLRESYTRAGSGDVRIHLRLLVREGRWLTEIAPSTQSETAAIRLGVRAAARL